MNMILIKMFIFITISIKRSFKNYFRRYYKERIITLKLKT